jgi:hypothetical protein
MSSIGLVLLVLIIGSLFKIRGWPLLVFGFIILYPMRSTIIPAEETLFGVLGPENLISFLLIIFYKMDNKYITVNRWYNDPIKKFGLLLMFFFMFIFLRITDIKDFFISGMELDPLPKRIFRDLILLITTILIAKRINDKRVYEAISKALILGSIVISLSIYFTTYLEGIGLVTGFELEQNVYGVEDATRGSGFLRLNPNGAGAYCAFIIGFFLGKIETSKLRKENIVYLIVIGVALLGITGTASRTSLIASAFVYILYLIRSRSNWKKNIIPTLIVSIIGFIIYFNAGTYLNARVNEAFDSQGASLVSRMDHWSYYLNDINNNPDILIYGNTHEQPTVYGTHNYYLYLVWSFGLGALFLFLFLMFKLLQFSDKNNRYLSVPLIYPLSTFLITSLAGGDPPNFTYIIIILISSGIIDFSRYNVNSGLRGNGFKSPINN